MKETLDLSEVLINKIIPSSVDAFSLLSLSPNFIIDVNLLEKNYLALQKKLHPDKLTIALDMDSDYLQGMASHINKAYALLKNPISRAKYLIELIDKDENLVIQNQSILITAMEWKEETTAIKNLDQANILCKEMEEIINDIEQKFSDAWEQKI